jgi:predicted ribosome quality control (RQC) complex YloA/Tae2 family protein
VIDSTLLRAIAAEAAGRLLEQAVDAVVPLGRFGYLLRFATPGRDALFFAVRPDRPRLHLAVRAPGKRAAVADRFAALLDREIGGARLDALEADLDDRRVTLRFRAVEERTLVIELFGRGANAALLDAAGQVLGTARDRPGDGPSSRLAPSSDRGPAHAGAIPAAFVLSERSLDEYAAGDAPAPGDLRVVLEADAPFEKPVATRFESPSAALAAACDLRDMVDDFLSERSHVMAQVRREKKRLEALRRRLAVDLDRLGNAEEDRRMAEALLAGLRAARVEGTIAVVPDPASMDGVPLRIPIDPALPLPANAQRLFDRYKKGKRGSQAVELRLAGTERRFSEWAALEAQAAAARSAEDLEAITRAMEKGGLVTPVRRKGAPVPRQAPPAPARVRRHETADGFVILVGRSGPENDLLTFKVASPWDFWLHAAGSPGAHVVVRNPKRLGVLPDNALRTAAEIAAFYSGLKESGKVEVHVTQRKNVRKRKGAPPGEVLLKRFRSVLVTPRLPAVSLDEV